MRAARHILILVENLPLPFDRRVWQEACALRDAGYEDSTVPNAHPSRTRVYFHDAEGNDWEFVQYHTDDPAARHDYEDA